MKYLLTYFPPNDEFEYEEIMAIEVKSKEDIEKRINELLAEFKDQKFDGDFFGYRINVYYLFRTLYFKDESLTPNYFLETLDEFYTRKLPK